MSETHFVIEPLDVTRHDRAGFSCGVAAVDNFLHRTANKLSKADQMRVFVMTPDGRTIAGFYAINSHAVDYRDLPAALTRQRPNHGSIPAAFISMIGRDRRFHGQGLGGDLLVDCLLRLARISDEIGLAVVLLDVLDCGDPARTQRRASLYHDFGFQPLPSQPQRLFLPIGTARKLLGA